MSRVTVSEIKSVNLVPTVKDPDVLALLPTTLTPTDFSCVLGGVSNAVSNGLRRTIACELPVLAIHANYENFSTTDDFVIPEMIIKRIRTIPVLQNIPADAEFELEYANATEEIIDVKTGMFRISRPGTPHGKIKKLTSLPFNATTTLLTLHPGCSIKITKMRLVAERGYVPEYGMHVMAFNARSLAVDQIPINPYRPEDGGVPSRLSNARVWRLGFNTNGVLPHNEIMARACDNIIERLRVVQGLIHTIEPSRNEYVFVVPGESDTIGNLLTRTIMDMNPGITMTYTPANIGRSVSMRVVTDDDIDAIYTNAIGYLITVYTTIRDQFM